MKKQTVATKQEWAGRNGLPPLTMPHFSVW